MAIVKEMTGRNRAAQLEIVKQKTAYEMATGDWSSDVCSSDPMTDHALMT